MAPLVRDGGLFLWLLLRNLLALALVALVVAVLHGALRGMGLPRLFWSHRPAHRFLAGLAATLLALEAVLATFSLVGDRWVGAGAGGLTSFAAWGCGLWALALASAVLLRFRHDRGAGAPALPSSRPRPGRLAPAIWGVGARIVVGNLDVAGITDQEVRWLSNASSPHAPTTGLASRTGYHASEVLPEDWRALRLSTAMRLSAAFPYVSPAVLLPTRPRRRVVDAGYFDNYGLELACGWLRQLLVARGKAWVQARISSVLIVQIRDNVSTLSVNPDTMRAFRRLRGETSGSLARALEGLSSPPEGLLAARESVALFRNDALVRAVSDLYAGPFGPDFVTTTVFEFAGEASLSWTLAPDEVSSIEAQVLSAGIAGKEQAIFDWLARGGQTRRV
jgi:hypothetical protein